MMMPKPQKEEQSNAFSSLVHSLLSFFPHASFSLVFSRSLSPPNPIVSLSLLPLERRHQLQDHEEDVDDVEVDREAREDVLVGAQRDGLATWKRFFLM